MSVATSSKRSENFEEVIFKEIFKTSEGSKERLKSLINSALQVDDLEVQDVEDLQIL